MWKLVGSRAKGDFQENSDWDVFLEISPIEVDSNPRKATGVDGHEKIRHIPKWPDAPSMIDLEYYRELIRKELDLGNDKIDIFIPAKCGSRFAVIHEGGVTVGMGSSISEACDKSKSEY